MTYDKLVRDRIPEIIQSKGKTPATHVAGDDEYRRRLTEKLQEEVSEFIADETPEEIADILEVIVAITSDRGWTLADIERLRAEKAAARGGFYERIVLEGTT